MYRLILVATTVGLLGGPAWSQENELVTVHNTYTDGTVEEPWVFSLPPNGCDFFNVRFDRLLFDGMDGYGTNGAHSKIYGVTVSTLHLGATNPWSLVGLFGSNLVIDASGNTPDLGNPLYPGSFTTDTDHVLDIPAGTFDCVTFDFPAHDADNLLWGHVVVNFFPGEDLFVGADNESGSGHSFADDSCYQTPVIPAPVEWCMNINTLPKTGTKAQLTSNHSSLDRCGDLIRLEVDSNETFGLFFAVDRGAGSGPVVLLFLVNDQYVLVPVPTTPSPLAGFYLNLEAGPLPAGFYKFQVRWFAIGYQTTGLSNAVSVIVN